MVVETPLLIVGGDSDPNTQRIVDQAHLRGIDYLFWDTDRDDACQIAWDFHAPAIDLGDQRVAPKSIFLRYNVFDGDASKNLAAFDVVQSFALAWPEIRILNRASMTDANNKSANLRHAIHAGFVIPDTFVLGNATPLAKMPCGDRHVIKPLGGGAHTRSVDSIANDTNALSELNPQFVQEKLDGENLRVFSIDGNLFCFHLITDELDYRDDVQVDVVQVDVPLSVIEPTHRLAGKLQFDYCALDFRCRNGMSAPVFLEINSFPMFVRFDDASENALADAVLSFLVSGS
ncbi:ATP-grasp domain-containing protein [Stieleria varia]|uniref:ATP-grasp domain-containing protein n=1 Tax=Stieleria varia TaxID=2528005 RepID=A0A5C6B9R2_9BACT|nr:hypothetical protein [Stieleria varia]TWU08457.1 hypothetical protein Pla52n_10400 [Stieleria varia]